MIQRVSGVILSKKTNYFVVEVGGGISLRIFASPHTLSALPAQGASVTVHTYLNVREDALELYGFLHESELDLFERLISVSGIGPKSAMGILGVAKADQLVAAINEGRAELITRASGVGRKTAERVILELKGKLASIGTQETLNLMESDVELEETLVSLGYTHAQSKAAIAKLDPKIVGFKERLKEALKRTKS